MGEWVSDWEASSRRQARALRDASAYQRLVWLSEAIGFARAAGVRPDVPSVPSDIVWDTQMELDGDIAAIVRYGANHRDDYGGIWLDNTVDRLIVAFTGDLGNHERALRARLRHPERIETRLVVHSEQELLSLQDRIWMERETLAAAGILINSIGISTDLNRLGIHVVEDVAGAQDELDRRYGAGWVTIRGSGLKKLL
jgi:hypothetical protein